MFRWDTPASFVKDHGVCLNWPAGEGCASITRWWCWIPKGLPEILDVVEMEIHHHIQSGLGGRETTRGEGEEREEGGEEERSKHTEMNHGNQTHNKVSAGRRAGSLSLTLGPLG